VDAHTMQVGDKRITADKIFIVAGARPLIPPMRGLKDVSFLTNDNVLRLERLPKSLAIIGGGYIACEFGHFFSAMGSQVTILQRNKRLVPDEEPEFSELLREKMGERMAVHVGTEVLAVDRDENGDGYRITARDTGTGEESTFSAEQILVAAGRRSNADLLQVENAGIETDDDNYVIANAFQETNVDGIWAMGDIKGRDMFKHVVNAEVDYAWHNSHHEHKIAMPYHAIPHAIFSHPQIASVGMTEAEAKQEHDVLVGHASYMQVAMGEAMMEIDGITKAVVDRETRRILGFHIMGAQASTLIQEVINAMATDEGIQAIASGLHVHPALPEVVLRTLSNLHSHD
jgi:mycothione reductase